MFARLYRLILSLLNQPAPATGLGLFRIGLGLVILQEIIFLFYFRHLIYDPVPYLDRASPVLHLFLLAWMGIALCLILGYHTRRAAVANYALWVIFVVFTPMWQDFDGGFDQLMTQASFLLIFLPSERGLSLDNLRLKWRHSIPGHPYLPPTTVPRLAYLLPVAISLGLLYLDSGLHKLSAPFWRNGLGPWLPSSMPYYMSPLDLSFLLNQEWLEKGIGYAVIGFQLLFLPLFWRRSFRVPLLLLGSAFHMGIILSLNIYPFGFGMLVHYLLMVPFGCWRNLKRGLEVSEPRLTVFFDENCPLCNRTVIFIEHFDFRRAIDFKGLQTHARNTAALASLPESTLLRDLFSLDRRGRLFSGIETYLHILTGLGYTAPLGWLLRLPGPYQLAGLTYRRIADNRTRLSCDASCQPPIALPLVDERPFAGFYARYAANDRQIAQRIAKSLVLMMVLQLNATIHYGILYRWAGTKAEDPLLALLDQASDSVINLSHALFGISPHALYMHDHFDHYNEIVAITHVDKKGHERWLPFVNEEGRLISPNWGRVQSMWANVAITSHMAPDRLEKFMRKITAYYGVELGLDLGDADFVIKAKRVEVPIEWEPDLRHRNMAAPWRDVGTIQWRSDGMHLSLPGLATELNPPGGERARLDH